MITRFLVFVALLIVAATLSVAWMTDIHGTNRVAGPSLASADHEEISERLRQSVEEIAFEIGSRSMNRYGALQRAGDHIEQLLRRDGLTVERQTYEIQGKNVSNLYADIPGSTNAREIVLLGAHYDSYRTSPGADCNASGVAALLELAHRLRQRSPVRTIRFAFFVNGERPWVDTENQGSRRFAEAMQAKSEQIVLALVLDSVGYYSPAEASQSFPYPLSSCYSTKGDFLAFFGAPGQKALVEDLVQRFTQASSVPVEGGALPSWFPGMHGADHLALQEAGFQAVQVTDTGANRWKDWATNYDIHTGLNYAAMASVVSGLEELTLDLARNGIVH